MRIDVWSDLVCPWCYIGKRRFERALAGFPQRGDVEIVHRSFQLDATWPRGVTSSRREALKAKYRLSDDQAATMDERMARVAAEEGLEYLLDGGLTGNTFGAHQVLHLARDRGIQDAVLECLYRGYFTERRSLFDHASLVELGAEAGLDPDDIRRVLDENTYAAQVAEDLAQARAIGATGVPFFVIDNRFAVSGAQAPEVFANALKQAYETRTST